MALYVGDGGAGMRQIGALYTAGGGMAAGIGALYTSVCGAEREIFAPGRLLYDHEIGDILEIRENGVPARYIVCERGYQGHGNVLLVREQALAEMAFRTDGSADYAGGLIDRFLTEDFPAYLDAPVRAALQTAEVPVCSSTQGASSVTVPRSVFLLSLTEVGGYDPEDGTLLPTGDGAILSWFAKQIEERGKRAALRCRNDAGLQCDWWLRTPFTDGGSYDGYVRCVLDSGTVVGRRPGVVQYVRPALVLRGTASLG